MSIKVHRYDAHMLLFFVSLVTDDTAVKSHSLAVKSPIFSTLEQVLLRF